MKKMMFAFLCCFGVGLTMMANPAQVSDDNIDVDAKNTTAVQTNVSERNDVSVHQTPIRIKYQLKKKIDFSKLNGPNRINRFDIDVFYEKDVSVKDKPGRKHPVPGGRIINPHGGGGPSFPVVVNGGGFVRPGLSDR